MISELQHLSLSIWLRKGNDIWETKPLVEQELLGHVATYLRHTVTSSAPLTSGGRLLPIPGDSCHTEGTQAGQSHSAVGQSLQLTRALLLNCSQTTCISRAWPLQHPSWSHLRWLPKQRLLRTQSAKQTISSPVSIRLQERETGSQSYYVHESICLLQQKYSSLVWPKVLW